MQTQYSTVQDSLAYHVLQSVVLKDPVLHTLRDETLEYVGKNRIEIFAQTQDAVNQFLGKDFGEVVQTPLRLAIETALSNTPVEKISFVNDLADQSNTFIREELDAYEDTIEPFQLAKKFQTFQQESFDGFLQNFADVNDDPEVIGHIDDVFTAARDSVDKVLKSRLTKATLMGRKKVSEIGRNVVDQVIDKFKAEQATESSGGAGGVTSPSNPFMKGTTFSGSEGKGNGGRGFTDDVYQEVFLYVEGIELPFEAISVSQGYGDLPNATIQVPPHSMLIDIARYYQPKVHVFYTDKVYGGRRLLFWGHIVAVNYSKSQHVGASINFQCIHKNALMDMITLDYSGYIMNAAVSATNVNPREAALKPGAINSKSSIIAALHGITGLQTDQKDLLSIDNADIADADITKLSTRFKDMQKRFIGMTGVPMNLWNQLKRDSYRNSRNFTSMTAMYIPLLEDGLQYFDRITGHNFLESRLQTEIVCPGGVPPDATKYPSLVPHKYKMHTMTAYSTQVLLEDLGSILNFSGEFTSIRQLFETFMSTVEYDVITLASPADVPIDPDVVVNADDTSGWGSIPRMAVETIVKPQIPFYYSPVCNVIFPKTYYQLHISQDDGRTPTRVTVSHGPMPQATQYEVNYRAPHSVREAVALGRSMSAVAASTDGATNKPEVNLFTTMASSFQVPGKYEQGTGIRHQKTLMPQWLALLSRSIVGEVSNEGKETWPSDNTTEKENLKKLTTAWVNRYGYRMYYQDEVPMKGGRDHSRDVLNPYSPDSKIHPIHRILFAAADYEFSKNISIARTGSVESVFNPYIVPGYPMEILDDSPNHPCFHAWCLSITHSITARTINTSISFAGATTYSELSNYYLQPVHPWLTTALDLISVSSNTSAETTETEGDYDLSGIGTLPDGFEYAYTDATVKSTILKNPVAKASADKFYRSVLGVNAVGVESVFDFANGRVIPCGRANGDILPGVKDSMKDSRGREMTPSLTTEGSLMLVSRPIESQLAIQEKFGIKFIDKTPENYNGSAMAYTNPFLELGEEFLMEPGQSMFLEYEEVSDFIKGYFK